MMWFRLTKSVVPFTKEDIQPIVSCTTVLAKLLIWTTSHDLWSIVVYCLFDTAQSHASLAVVSRTFFGLVC